MRKRNRDNSRFSLAPCSDLPIPSDCHRDCLTVTAQFIEPISAPGSDVLLLKDTRGSASMLGVLRSLALSSLQGLTREAHNVGHSSKNLSLSLLMAR